MKVWNTVASAFIAFAAFTSSASAAIIYDNIANQPASSSCAWQCSSTSSIFAAQKFTTASTITLESAAFTSIYYDQSPSTSTGVNWQLLMADGSGGLPGTQLAAGSSSMASITDLGGTSIHVWLQSFTMSGVTLDPGTYYFAMHREFSTEQDYLGQGLDTNTTAAWTFDGGTSWRASYVGNT